MSKKILLVLLCLTVTAGLVYAGGIDRLDRHQSQMLPDENHPFVNTNQYHPSIVMNYEGEKLTGDYWFGPEISTQLSGFYDYQTNGENKHAVNRVDGTMMHAIMMTATDSTLLSDSRRTVYATSTDDGTTWTFVIQVPDNLRSGFASLTTLTDGSAVIGNHYAFSGPLMGVVSYDAAPGAGSFAGVPIATGSQQVFVWPGVARMSNGNILVAGEDYYGGAATDTGATCIFNSTTHLMSGHKKFVTTATSQLNMRWTYAAGPGGKAIYVLDAISDLGGSFGLNRMYIFKSTDNAVTWDGGSVLFDAQIVGGDTLTAFFGLDAIYDAAGNYYVAFNTTDPSGTFASAKMWISKNGAAPSLVANHTQIPGSASTVMHADAGLCTIDHPALALSNDGSTIFCAFSVQFQDDTLNAFNKAHIFYNFAPTSTMIFGTPIQVTNSGAGSFDERYPCLSAVAPNLGGTSGTTLYLTYQKDTQPGSCAFNDNAPVTRSRTMFRKIYQADIPIGIHNIGSEIPKQFSLAQNFPNPFNPSTKIQFALPKDASVTLQVYNVQGQLVAVLANNEFTKAGVKEVTFNASGFASGVYFYSIKADNFTETKKMILVK